MAANPQCGHVLVLDFQNDQCSGHTQQWIVSNGWSQQQRSCHRQQDKAEGGAHVLYALGQSPPAQQHVRQEVVSPPGHAIANCSKTFCAAQPGQMLSTGCLQGRAAAATAEDLVLCPSCTVLFQQ